MNRFLSERSTTYRDLAGRSVRFSFSPGENAGSIRVDPELLHQALVHLVANARDAMPGGGELTISTDAAERPGRIEGIDAAPRTRIFQPFASLKTGSEGMGLPSIYGFIKQSGGYIFVDSRPGHGTTFRIHFPRMDRPEALLRGNAPPLAGTPVPG